MVEENLFHGLERDLGDGLLFGFGLAKVFGELGCLECNLVEDTFAKFLVDGLDLFGGELLV
jgi:hypothetical protein